MTTESESTGPSSEAVEILIASGEPVPEGSKEYLPEKDAQTETEEVTEAPADPAAEKVDEGQKPAKKTFQERMDDLTKARREAERERDALKQEIADLKATITEAGGEVDEDYLEQIIEERLTAREQARKAEKVRQDFAARQNQTAAKHDDYFEAVVEGAEANRWACTAEMNAAIMESEVGPEIAYHLAKNPDESRRIAALPVLSQVREIGKLEVRLSASEVPATETKPAKLVTSAPAPAPTLRGTGGQFKVAPDTDDFAAFDKAYGG